MAGKQGTQDLHPCPGDLEPPFLAAQYWAGWNIQRMFPPGWLRTCCRFLKSTLAGGYVYTVLHFYARSFQKSISNRQGLPWWSGAKTPPFQCKRSRFDPGQGARPHMPQLRDRAPKINKYFFLISSRYWHVFHSTGPEYPAILHHSC